MARIRIPFVVKAAISIVLLALVLLKVDLLAALQALSSANVALCLLSLGVALVAWLVNTRKWQVLLSGPGIRPRYPELLRLNMIGIFYNLVLPGQIGGEVVKGFKLAHLGISGKHSAISVIADRVTGLLALLMLGMIGVAFSPMTSGVNLMPWLLALAMILGSLTVILITGKGLDTLSRWLPSLPLIRRLNPQNWHLELGDQSWQSMLISMFLAIVFQLGIVLSNYLFCVALDISISYLQLLSVVAAVSLLQALPISIAGLGVREGAYVYLLSLQGVAEPMALALSLLTFGTQVLFALAGGLLQIQELWETRHKRALQG